MAGKAGKWIGIGCGGCLAVAIIAGAAGYFLLWKPAKAKLAKAGVDFSGDAKQVAASMMMVGVKEAKPKLMKVLPAEERVQVEEAITLLDRKVGSLKPEDLQELADAFKAFSRSVKEQGGVPTAGAAHQFGEDLKRLAKRVQER